MELHGITFDPARLLPLFRGAGVVRAYLFVSILTPRFGPSSDIDILVETDRIRPPGLLTLGGLQMDLQDALGRTVHLTLLGGVPDADRAPILARARLLDAA